MSTGVGIETAREALDRGLRHERGGAPERARQCYEDALRLDPAPAMQAEAWRRLADAHRAHGDWAASLDAARRSAAVAAAAGLGDLHAEALNAEGNTHLLRGDVAAALPLFERALAAAADARVRGIALQSLGVCAARRGDSGEARERFTASLACFRTAGYGRGELIALINVASVTVDFGDPAAALPLLDEAGTLARRLDDLDLLLLVVTCEAEALGKLGRPADAEARLTEAIGHFATAGNHVRRAECLLVLGGVHAAQPGPDAADAARRCYAAAERLAAECEAPAVRERAAAALRGLEGEGSASGVADR